VGTRGKITVPPRYPRPPTRADGRRPSRKPDDAGGDGRATM